ncbi:MAG: hypothetical protein P1U71_10675, partial [Sneathiella sp.]
MKLATLKDGSRDGKLVVVTKDLSRCIAVPSVAAHLQGALDSWEASAPKLQEIADKLESDASFGERFNERTAHSPLPRAYQWADGSAYVN